MDFLQYIVKEELILIPVLWILGTILKQTPKIPDWFIPYVLIGSSVLGRLFLIGFNVNAVIQGVLVGGASVGLHQIAKQTGKKY
jgi:hypothetical protein